MEINNNEMCDMLYRIRDLINQGEFDHAVALTDVLKKELVTAYVYTLGTRCLTLCTECTRSK